MASHVGPGARVRNLKGGSLFTQPQCPGVEQQSRFRSGEPGPCVRIGGGLRRLARCSWSTAQTGKSIGCVSCSPRFPKSCLHRGIGFFVAADLTRPNGKSGKQRLFPPLEEGWLRDQEKAAKLPLTRRRGGQKCF